MIDTNLWEKGPGLNIFIMIWSSRRPDTTVEGVVYCGFDNEKKTSQTLRIASEVISAVFHQVRGGGDSMPSHIGPRFLHSWGPWYILSIYIFLGRQGPGPRFIRRSQQVSCSGHSLLDAIRMLHLGRQHVLPQGTEAAFKRKRIRSFDLKLSVIRFAWYELNPAVLLPDWLGNPGGPAELGEEIIRVSVVWSDRLVILLDIHKIRPHLLNQLCRTNYNVKFYHRLIYGSKLILTTGCPTKASFKFVCQWDSIDTGWPDIFQSSTGFLFLADVEHTLFMDGKSQGDNEYRRHRE